MPTSHLFRLKFAPTTDRQIIGIGVLGLREFQRTF